MSHYAAANHELGFDWDIYNVQPVNTNNAYNNNYGFSTNTNNANKIVIPPAAPAAPAAPVSSSTPITPITPITTFIPITPTKDYKVNPAVNPTATVVPIKTTPVVAPQKTDNSIGIVRVYTPLVPSPPASKPAPVAIPVVAPQAPAAPTVKIP
jgi:hypothetical protein